MTQPHRNPATGLSLATGPARPKHLPRAHTCKQRRQRRVVVKARKTLSVRMSVEQLSPDSRSPAASVRACFSHINNRKADRYKNSLLHFTCCVYNPVTQHVRMCLQCVLISLQAGARHVCVLQGSTLMCFKWVRNLLASSQCFTCPCTN